jgi:excisionase family DNA binding protein
MATTTPRSRTAAELLTIGQASDITRIPLRRLRLMVRGGLLPVIRDGRKVRIPASWANDGTKAFQR